MPGGLLNRRAMANQAGGGSGVSSDVRDLIELDLETVADVAGVIDGVEVVDGAVGNAGGLNCADGQEEGGQQSHGEGQWRAANGGLGVRV
jgi:hypothetical protein